MGSSQPATTTQIQKVELPAWVDQASQQNYQFAEQVADRPFQQYQGQRVAPLSQGEQQAGGILNRGMNQTDMLSSASALAIARAGATQPSFVSGPGNPLFVTTPQAANDVNVGGVGQVGNVADVSATRFSQADLSGYLNPFTNNVVDTTMAGMRDNLALAGQKADDAAMGAGAWGSSRSGVQQAVLSAQGAKEMASTEAGLRSAAYTDAANRLQADNTSALQARLANQQSALTTQGRNVDISRGNQAVDLSQQTANQNSALQTAQQRLAAETTNQGAYSTAQGMRIDAEKANQAAGLQAANLGLQSGVALGSLADSATNNAGKNALLSSQIGANARSVEQANLDAEAMKWQEAYDAPVTALNTRLAALGMSPYGKTTTTQETKKGGESSNGFMSAIGGVMSFLPFLFSDEKLKKNVRTVGTTDAGVPLREYEYKGFMAKAMPGKQIGVLAQDMEKVDPGAVRKIRGPDGKMHKAVNYDRVGRGFMGRRAA
jgi:hypothetical protein